MSDMPAPVESSPGHGVPGRFVSWWLVGIGGLMVAALVVMGRSWWCQQADLLPWSWDVWSSHCSQHVIDPYSLSHIQHGLGLFLLLSLVFPRRLSVAGRAVVIACIEAGWELLENTELVIQRYREATISLDYFGDTIANSLGDYGVCMLGAYLAHKLGGWATVGLFLVLEIVCLFWIRDSLIINIVMLLSPVEAIRQWQLSG